MAFTDAEKVQIRRHLGYPITGNPAASPAGGATLGAGFQGHRFHQAYGRLEWLLNWLQPVEAAVITGRASAMITLSAVPNGIVGAALEPSIQLVLGATDEILVHETTSIDTVYSVAQAFAGRILSNSSLVAAGFQAMSPISLASFGDRQPPEATQPYPGLQVTAPSDFNIILTSAAPLNLHVDSPSVIAPDPKVVIDDQEYRGYLSILSKLESDIARATENLDTTKADVWTARQDEVAQRQGLYDLWRQRLADFMDIPLYETTGYSVRSRGLSRSIMRA